MLSLLKRREILFVMLDLPQEPCTTIRRLCTTAAAAVVVDITLTRLPVTLKQEMERFHSVFKRAEA